MRASAGVVFDVGDAWVRRSRAVLLRGAQIEVRRATLVALVGPNGAGKSTLLSVLAGDLPLASGRALFEGRDLASWKPAELARRRAVLTQSIKVGFPFTVSEVVSMGRAPWARTPESERDEHLVAAALAEAEVSHLLGRSFPSLSGGEQARVAFARLLAQDTPVLLLDEPTAALDIGHQEDLFRTVRRRVDRGATAVVVVHDLALASRFADEVVLLDGGRTVARGTPAEVMRSQLLSAVYRHPLRVTEHPVDGSILVAPCRKNPTEESIP
ncbi:MAG: heme ABC transporter ATP-binding protein [Microthrixaceae bacterium]|nr:heme ABC transporter ATP-binding protein [Microthrixaceae bacterium]